MCDPQTPEVWELWDKAQLPPRTKHFAQRVLWHNVTVHARVFKRSGTDKCPVCSQKETVEHATVECSMYMAVAATIQHYFDPVPRKQGENPVWDMMSTATHGWTLNTEKGRALWSAQSAHWRYICEVKARASPVFTFFLTSWLRELNGWVDYFTGEQRQIWVRVRPTQLNGQGTPRVPDRQKVCVLPWLSAATLICSCMV